MGLLSEEISCPKCGSLCNVQKSNIFLWIVYLIIIVALGFVTFGISIVCFFIYLAIDKSKKNKPVQCTKCGYRFIP
jgi:DNA-directed RNA polymerase subunit RPC12/RpoP